MRITEEGAIAFKSAPEFYAKEQDGRKPNTERWIDSDMLPLLCTASGPRTRIRITLLGDTVHFERELTDVTVVGELLGKALVIFSWRHE